MTYILDACSLIALYKKETGFDKIRALLNEAMTGQTEIYMHSVNLIDFIDNTIFSEASRLKAQYAIPLGDAIGLATAIKFDGSFVSADHSDLERIEKAISIFFFR